MSGLFATNLQGPFRALVEGLNPMLFTASNDLFSYAGNNPITRKLVQAVIGKTADVTTGEIFLRSAFFASLEVAKAEIKEKDAYAKTLNEQIDNLNSELSQAKGEDLRQQLEEQIRSHKSAFDVKSFEIQTYKAINATLEKEVASLKSRLRSTEEDFNITRRMMEEVQITAETQLVRLKILDKEGSYFKEQYQDIKADKQKQRDEFVFLQSKVLRMSNLLKTLASNITGYLEENKLMRKQLERVDKRHGLGLHDMTPRPNYKEIFSRRGFSHYKEDLGLKIVQQQYSSAEVIEELIDMIKALEVKKHFSTGVLLKSSENSKNMIKIPEKSRLLHKKKKGSIQQELPLTSDGKPALRGSRRDISREQKANTPQSARRSRLGTSKQINPIPEDLNQSKQQPSGSPPNSSPHTTSKSSDMDSQISELSDNNYKLIRSLEQDMDGLKKGFSNIVQI